jgi:hypothetical protein
MRSIGLHLNPSIGAPAGPVAAASALSPFTAEHAAPASIALLRKSLLFCIVFSLLLIAKDSPTVHVNILPYFRPRGKHAGAVLHELGESAVPHRLLRASETT